jgi:adenylate cyclase, class 2
MKDPEKKDQELEVKFYVEDLAAIEARLNSIGAHLEAPRVFEVNLRFDTPDGKLARAAQVIRLRQDSRSRLTYKGPASNDGGARLRPEIEFEVSDFQSAQAFIEALGYQVAMAYEKYRTTYVLEGTEVVLDELPYGNFVEIEGPDSDKIHAIADRLGLAWHRSVQASYVVLFYELRNRLGLVFNDLTFDNFAGRPVTVTELGVQPADAW